MNSKLQYVLLFLILSSCYGDSMLGYKEGLCGIPKYADKLYFPGGVKGYFDYDQALACAKELNKPVFLHFTSHGSSTANEIDVKLYLSKRNSNVLRRNFIVLNLYVDDKRIFLDSSEYKTIKWFDTISTIKRYSDLNSYIQNEKFNSNSIPFFAILDTNENNLIKPFHPNFSSSRFYYHKMKKALKAFRKQQE